MTAGKEREARRRKNRKRLNAQGYGFDRSGLPSGDIAAICLPIGERNKLNAEAARNAASSILNMHVTCPDTMLILVVDGYDNDKCELWDIAEVRDYMLLLFDGLFAKWPGGDLADLNLEHNSLVMVMACTGALRVTGWDARVGKYTMEAGHGPR